MQGWLDKQLSEGERTRIAEARRKALVDLAEAITEPSYHEQTVAGLPSARMAHALLHAMQQTLLTPARNRDLLHRHAVDRAAFRFNQELVVLVTL